MDIVSITRMIAVVAFALGALGILFQIKSILDRPFKRDLSRAQGREGQGILYAFTLGMAPWEKESTRMHWVAYIRGIVFHVGVFAGFGILFASPWADRLPDFLRWAGVVIAGVGSIAGFAGIFIRLAGPNERAISLPDDYFSVFLTSLFAGCAGLALAFPGFLPVFYLVSAFLTLYVPLSKIRHCAYFFYSKFFFGKGFGHRGVIGQPKSKYAE